MRVYLDVCCLNRPFDDQSQSRIRLEAEAIILILARLQAREWEWWSSEAVEFEVSQSPDGDRRRRVGLLAGCAHQVAQVTPREVQRAQTLQREGVAPLDALHVACAEQAKVDILLTTDDQLCRVARRLGDKLGVRVDNPLAWLAEVMPR